MPPFELKGEDGLRLLDSALAAPRWPYHRTIHEKAAALFRSLVKNHALNDGNKRLGVTALDVFLRINRVDFKLGQANIVATARIVAAHEGNFPLEILTMWIRGGCTGRPRTIVGLVADGWPDFRRFVATGVRLTDRAYGKRARVPGSRVPMSRDLMYRIAAAVSVAYPELIRGAIDQPGQLVLRTTPADTPDRVLREARKSVRRPSARSLPDEGGAL